jgi:hypothetical protein
VAAALLLLVPMGIFWWPFAPSASTQLRATGEIGPMAATTTAEPLPTGLIEAVHVLQYRDIDQNSKRIGEIGVDSDVAREEDLVRVVARFNAQVYCYLIAFNPDGTEQLCHPADNQTAPQRLSVLEYPAGESAYRLTDGTGQQAFAVVASRDPLPAFDTWRKQSGTAPWQHFDGVSVVRFDGHVVTPVIQGTDRGKVEKLKGVEPFERLCEFLAEQSMPDGVQAVAFPVLAKPPPRTDANRQISD